MEDLIILRVEKLPDFYITVSANYERSCFGMGLEELLYISGPVAIMDDLTTNGEITQSKLEIPKELFRLVDALIVSKALREVNLFATNGEQSQVKSIFIIFIDKIFY